MNRTTIIDHKIGLLAAALAEFMAAQGHEKIATQLMLDITSLGANEHKDGRSLAWGEARRAKHGEAMSQSWSDKRSLKDTTTPWLKFTHSDAPPKPVGSDEDLAKELGISVKTLTRRLVSAQQGLIVYKNMAYTIYARSKDDMDTLRHQEATEKHDQELVIHLPRAPKPTKKASG